VKGVLIMGEIVFNLVIVTVIVISGTVGGVHLIYKRTFKEDEN